MISVPIKLRFLIIVMGVGLIVVAALVAAFSPRAIRLGAEEMVNFAFYPQRTEEPQQWEWFPSTREPFEVAADDGTLLEGYFLPSKEKKPAGTIVILHGHLSCADQMAGFAQDVVQAGFNAVVYDARAHGKSGGSVCSFGLKEAGDAKRIARYLLETHKGSGPVFLWGISMGAAVGAQALAGDTPFSGGVLFAPFSNLDDMISATLQSRGVSWLPGLSSEVRSRIRNVLGVSPAEVSPKNAATSIRVPVLVVHGDKDDRIPVAQGRAVFEAIPDARKQFLELPKAGHDDLINFEEPWGETTLQRMFIFLKHAA